MRLARRTKATFAVAAVLFLVGVAAWGQNLEVTGNAWFATGDSAGRTGVGTTKPIGKLHVVSSGGFLDEDASGLTPPSGVPIIAQSDSTAIGVLNSDGRAVFAVNIDANDHSVTSRGLPSFHEKSSGTWRRALLFYDGGTIVYDRLSARGGLGVRDDAEIGGSLEVGGGHTVLGNVAIGTTEFSNRLGWQGSVNVNGEVRAARYYDDDAEFFMDFNGDSVINNLYLKGRLSAGNSDIYFTNSEHNYTGAGGAAGNAAIENAADYGTLMILGRAGTAVGRKVDVWDYLQVNGRIRATAGVALYKSACATGEVLTTAPTCPDQIGSITWTRSNILLGRLVDP
jgi:hypothetical protein